MSTTQEQPIVEPARPLPTAPDAKRITHGLARLVLAAFIFTFIIARILVILIMGHHLPPQLFFHVSGTHVHHLNYGIFILSVCGGFLLFVRPSGKPLGAAAIIYGIGLALTFDEFGMWLHLGGPYWQRASFDAITLIAAVLTLITYGSTIRHWHPRHRLTTALLAIALIGFGYILYDSAQRYGGQIGTLLEQLENSGPG